MWQERNSSIHLSGIFAWTFCLNLLLEPSGWQKPCHNHTPCSCGSFSEKIEKKFFKKIFWKPFFFFQYIKVQINKNIYIHFVLHMNCKIAPNVINLLGECAALWLLHCLILSYYKFHRCNTAVLCLILSCVYEMWAQRAVSCLLK